eukprot:GHVP01000652.1.p1 GENE.GHVP01000652.1~~GHVP01000652.1.p1  ORF type:complete len:239 (+),score=62.58 GHVP01000652.1:127-843(+)
MDLLKQEAAFTAVDTFVTDGLVVGLGTGSTAKFVVDRIGEKLKSGELKDIRGIPTSEKTRIQAETLGIPLISLEDVEIIDVAIDGADEIDPKSLALVKGRGGALLREKMVAFRAKKFVIVADSSKIEAKGIGSGGSFPIEIVKFASKSTAKSILEIPEISKSLYKSELRKEGQELFVTDNGNFIFDIYLSSPIKDCHALGNSLKAIPGVVEHGLFLDIASCAFVADQEKGILRLPHTS